MKKRVLCAAIASMMVLSMAACSSGSTAATTAETKASEAETTTVAASSEKAEETTAASTEGGTLIVGFDQDFPPMGFLGDNGEYTGFDRNWHRKLQSALVWNIRHSQLHGMQRIWNWNPETLIVSGMDLP